MKAFIIFATMTLLVSCAPKVQEDSVVPGSELGFSVKVFRNALRQSAPDENVTVSPYSAGVALSMLAEVLRDRPGPSWTMPWAAVFSVRRSLVTVILLR